MSSSERNVLNQLQDEAHTLAQRALDLLSAAQHRRSADCRDEAVHLAHYTSLDALVSMLQADMGGLRLCLSSAMNDPREGEATTDDRIFCGLVDDLAGRMPWLRERYSSSFVCCFVGIPDRDDREIDAGDDLLFWRLYGSECRGVSITIPPHKSTDLLGCSLVRQVTYADEPPVQIELPSISTLLGDLDGLRTRALKRNLWTDASQDVLPYVDRLCGERFLHKHSHYEMEREYRAIVFDTEDDVAAGERSLVAHRGMHVQNGLLRKFVQVPQLGLRSVFTTGTQITIGSNVPEPRRVEKRLAQLIEKGLSLPPKVVSIRVSEIPYRPR